MVSTRAVAVWLLRLGTIVMVLAAAAVAAFHFRPHLEPSLLESATLRSGMALMCSGQLGDRALCALLLVCSLPPLRPPSHTFAGPTPHVT